MNTNNRSEALLEVIRQGLEISGERQTRVSLGNRSEYLGLSDLARYAECPRAALLGKIFPRDTSLNKLLTLQRGHWFEHGLANCFKNLDLKFMSQLEISVTNSGVPIKGHLDFTLVWNKPYPAIRIVEVKSICNIPEHPYPAHSFQAQAQVNLLRHFWNKPVFGLRNEAGTIVSQNLTVPQICKQNLGIDLPDNPDSVSVESWLLCLSMREAACFGPYEYNAQLLENLFSQAREYWSLYGALRHGKLADDGLPYSQGFNPLCAYCDCNASCPKFHVGELQTQWEDVIKRHELLKAQKAGLDSEIRDIETSLKDAHKLSGCKDWINAGAYRFRVTNTAGRKTLDKDALHSDLVSIFCAKGIEDIDVDDLFARNERTGAASSRLNIMPLN